MTIEARADRSARFDPLDPLCIDAEAFDVDRVLTEYQEQGFARLGRVVSGDALARLRTRADDLMLGRVPHEGFFFQLDTPTGRYEELEFGRGYEGPSLNYRKLEKLENDAVFRSFLENKLFARIAHARLGSPVTLYRAVLFSKGANGGSPLPWHQDAGNFWGLSQDPELQIWTALDDAPIDAGCVEVVPRSHHDGLVTPLGGVVPRHKVSERNAEADAVSLPAKAGEVILIHNYLWHRSAANRTPNMRRAFTICLMNGATRCLRKKRQPRVFPRLFES